METGGETVRPLRHLVASCGHANQVTSGDTLRPDLLAAVENYLKRCGGCRGTGNHSRGVVTARL